MSSSNRARARRPVQQPRTGAQRPALQAAREDDGAWAVPEEKIFDLDALYHEAREERFRFKAQGRVFEAFVPEEVDWLENSKIPERNPTGNDPRPLMRVLLGDQYADFEKLKLQTGQVGALIVAWQEWHGIVEGESGASRDS